MIKVEPHPLYTIQIGKCTVEFDKDYHLIIRKKINGKTTYEAEIVDEDKPNDPALEKMIIDTVIRYLNTHGAFSPKNENK